VKHFWIAAVALAPIAACSGSDTNTDTTTSTGSAGAGCVEFASAKTNVSFKKDVVPVFQLSCNFSSCHSSESSSPQENLALGAPNGSAMTDEDIKAVHDAIVSGTSERSSLSMVEPGAPEKSWLLAKIAYSSFGACEAIKSTCAPEGCGTRMPLNSPALDPAAVDAIAGWIKEGALNN